LEVAYDTVDIAMDKMEHKAADFIKAVNPFGKLPVITLADGRPLIESGAQLCYLADVFDPNVQTAEARAIVAQWCMFANARSVQV
jgi:glutathione S-transferase